MPPVIWKFQNDCRVIYEKKTCADKSTILICCNVGSIHETKDTTGFCHLLEHLLLVSGTESQTYLNIFKTFDLTGSDFNAFTTKTQTFFSVTCLTEHLKDFIVIFGYIMFTSNVGTRSIEKEQRVIKQENLSDANQSNLAIFEIFEAHMYNNTPYQNPIDGQKGDKSKQLNLKHLLSFYKKYYVPGNITVSIVSSITSDKLLEFFKHSLFFTMNKIHVDAEIKIKRVVEAIVNPGYYIVSKNMDTSTVMIGFFIPVYKEDEIGFYFEVLKYYLNRMDGLLFNYFRTNQGSAYRFNADIEHEEIGGYFSINVETTPNHVMETLGFCISTFRTLINHGISEKDLYDVKKFMKESMKMKYDNMEELAEYNSKQINSFKKEPMVPFTHIYKKYYKPIQTVQIHEMIKKHFISSQLVVSIVGKNTPAHSEVEKLCASLA